VFYTYHHDIITGVYGNYTLRNVSDAYLHQCEKDYNSIIYVNEI